MTITLQKEGEIIVYRTKTYNPHLQWALNNLCSSYNSTCLSFTNCLSHPLTILRICHEKDHKEKRPQGKKATQKRPHIIRRHISLFSLWSFSWQIYMITVRCTFKLCSLFLSPAGSEDQYWRVIWLCTSPCLIQNGHSFSNSSA